MTTLPPLRFAPVFRQYLWGGTRLRDVLQKPTTPGESFAESWEVVDHGEDQSQVVAGELAGWTLSQVVAQHGPALLGRHGPLAQFPLLFKFLDCQQNLSVQVHPNDQQAAQLDPPDLGKTEAWLILAAEPGSRVYAGLKHGFDRPALAREVARGTTELCLHSLEPAVGDCIFIPAGTVHALGAGLLVAEIQQASDTTYRLSDWNRLGSDGQPRELHIEAGLDAINFQAGPVDPQQPDQIATGVERLVACDKFMLDRHRFASNTTLGGDDRFHIVSVVAGEATLTVDGHHESLALGDTLLLPACCSEASISTSSETTLLDMYLP